LYYTKASTIRQERVSEIRRCKRIEAQRNTFLNTAITQRNEYWWAKRGGLKMQTVKTRKFYWLCGPSSTPIQRTAPNTPP